MKSKRHNFLKYALLCLITAMCAIPVYAAYAPFPSIETASDNENSGSKKQKESWLSRFKSKTSEKRSSNKNKKKSLDIEALQSDTTLSQYKDTVAVADTVMAEIPPIDTVHCFDDTLLDVFQYMDAALTTATSASKGNTPDSGWFSAFDSTYIEWLSGGICLSCGEKETSPVDSSITSDKIYLERLASLPNIIPITYNPIIKRFIEVYTKQRRLQVSKMLALSQYYFPIFEQALEEKGLPIELKYLPIVESALNPAATSRTGAAGLWQFMYQTGKIYGLQINSLVDERRDPMKSTYAAINFLSSLYTLFGDWNLAIAAYNCGPGNVRKAIARSGGKRNFWDIYFYLPRETRSYVPFFIAANYVMTYNEEHGIYPANIEFPFLCDTFSIRENMHFEQISAVLKVPVSDVRLLNPHFRNNIAHGTKEKPGTLYLPAQYTSAFIHYEDSIPKYRAKELLTKELNKLPAGYATGSGSSFVYRVKSGDNLSVIAKRYHVTVSQLRKWNGLKSDFLRIGQRLIIYQ